MEFGYRPNGESTRPISMSLVNIKERGVKNAS